MNRRWWHASRLLLCAAVCALLIPVPPAAAQDAEVIHQVRSRYQLITVLDTASGYRQLVFDGRLDGTDAIQSEMNLANPDVPTLSYARHMMAALPVVDRPRRVLVVGLGGACIQRYLRKLLPDATIETAELDPEIRNVAATYFFFKEDARQIVHLGDGREFIERSKDKYDVIFLDAFTATSIPHHLTTREFLQAVKDRLADGGVACANLWDAEASYWDMVKTYSTVFPELHIVKCAASGNSVVVAMPAKTALTVRVWTDKAAAFEKAHPTGLDLPKLILQGAGETTSIPDTARVLVDKGGDRPARAESLEEAGPGRASRRGPSRTRSAGGVRRSSHGD
jgi:spermidine synthase